MALYLRGIEETKAAGKHKRAGSASGVWLEACEAGGNAAGIKASEMSADVGMTGDCLTVLGDGDTLVCIGGDGNGSTVSLYSASKGLSCATHGHESLVCCVAAQPVGDKIACGGATRRYGHGHRKLRVSRYARRLRGSVTWPSDEERPFGQWRGQW